MNQPPDHPNKEANRLGDLKSYDILDTAREEDFDDIVVMAAEICDAPMALVSLVDQNRQWIKASHGLDIEEIPRNGAFCNTAIEHPDEVLVVPDAYLDPRFSDLSIVKKAPHVRFYSGAPLVSPQGNALGAICVLDTKPRKLSPIQIRHLKTLSRRVMSELELRRRNRELSGAEEKRREAFEALAHKEEQFRLALGGYPGGLWDLNPNSGEVEFSEGYWRILGFKEGEGPRNLKESMERVHPDDRERILEELQKHLKNPSQRYEVEFRMKEVGDGYKWFISNGQAIGKVDEAPSRVVGLLRDITVRKLGERTIQQAERQMREAQRLGGMGSWYFNIAANQSTWSEQLFLMVGWKPDGNPVDYSAHADLFTPESWALLRKQMEQIQETREPYEVELEFVRPDKSHGWMSARGECVVDDEDKVIGLQGIAQDITARRESDRRLQEQATLIDQAPDAFIVRDMNDVIVFWSAGAERVYGYSSAEALGKPFPELIDVDEETFGEAKQATLKSGSWSGEIVKRKKAGVKLILESRWTLLRDAKGKNKSILITDTNITEKKKIEAQYLRAQRMEGIGTLAGGIAHDLNNTLAPIMMAVTLLRRELDNERKQRVIDNIENSAKRGAELVKQVLTFARGLDGNRVPLNLRHVTKEIEGIIENTFPKNIKLSVDVPRDLPLVLGDPTQLNQILLNLCVNARDAMPKGGKLEISGHSKEVDEQYVSMNHGAHAGEFVLIEVTDTGSGIPPEIIDRIYEPFFTTKEVGSGTGLGLATILGIVKSHHGFINVYSEVGSGTTFKVYLPIASSPSDDAEEEALPLIENLR